MPRRRTTAVSRKELAHYRTHILEALREDGVVCLECGHLYQGLANHLRLHRLTGQAYREKWGYSRGRALIAPAVHDRMSQVAFDRNLPALSPPRILLCSSEGRQQDRHGGVGKPAWSTTTHINRTP